MTRLILFSVVLAATGCASQARFVERRPDGGVVAAADYKHRDDAIDLIHDEVGPAAAILHEEEVVTGADVKTITEVGNGNILTRIGHWFTGTQQVATTDTQSIKATEWRITYTTNAPAKSP
jgi:hypothetical protein